MNISFSWLKDFIEIQETPEVIAELLTMSGLEVEAIETFQAIPGGLEGLVIGEVLTCQKHPQADRLTITTVDIGQTEPLQIVCGASNVAVGQKVIVATLGATLYPTASEPFQIKKVKIRGVESCGMICAEDEIGVGESHQGIMVLSTSLPNGTPAAEHFSDVTDKIFVIGLTPNRVDAASHWGVAREIRALLRRSLKINPSLIQEASCDGSCPITIRIEDVNACKRYAGVLLQNVKVAPSPQWLQNRLKAIGLKPINNVVDITNYILHGLGQPLHAFDAHKIEGNQIIVRKGFNHTQFMTLDGQIRKLSFDDLMICNAKEPMCIAGVFGGLHSAISENTTSVFLESAYFTPETIRQTSQYHNLKTDASFRFERGTDINMVIPALQVAIQLMKEICGAAVVGGITDVYPIPVEPAIVYLRYAQLKRIIGNEIPFQKVKEILELLDMKILEESSEALRILIPPYRVDVTREIDVIEEILRIYGYNNVETSPYISSTYLADAPLIDKHIVRWQLSEMLAGSGCIEIITNSLSNPDYTSLMQIFSPEKDITILNKLSHELSVLRQTLLYTGLEVLAYNINRKQTDLKFYEFGKVYYKENQKYFENELLALFFTGNRSAETWQERSEKTRFHTLLEVVHKILVKLGVDDYAIEPKSASFFAYGCQVIAQKREIAQIGLVNSAITKYFDIKQEVFYAEIDWLSLAQQLQTRYPCREIPKFPEVRRDLSLVIDKKVSFSEIKQIAFQTEQKLLRQINCFDVYEGSNLGENKKAYAISFILQDDEKTLTDVQIDNTMQRLMEAYESKLGAIIRK
ncbi:MAG: phenylalanine--tRNA ligase subunit beta [Cytophagales bacterium]|nr:phenylalanine--tRNA ligase subunit beta [Cytophagales bacterium]MDW8385018.1 phenylalanine--tRNA ligase subunit beta [Flammeovirgaceae bacterium]